MQDAVAVLSVELRLTPLMQERGVRWQIADSPLHARVQAACKCAPGFL